MAALDAKARATALKLLNKFGKSVTLTIVTEGTYDPTTGEVSGSSTSTEIPKALLEDIKSAFDPGLNLNPGKGIPILKRCQEYRALPARHQHD